MTYPLAASFFDINQSQVALALSGVALIWTIMHWRRTTVARAKRKAVEPDKPAPAASALSVRELTAEIQALLADLEETARRVAAQIENRQKRLDLLVQEADAKIKRLESLSQSTSEHDAPVEKPAANTPISSTPVGVAKDAASMLSRLRQERGAPQPALDPAYQPIYSLADQGKSPREIAQALGRQPGEIELILALRGQQQRV